MSFVASLARKVLSFHLERGIATQRAQGFPSLAKGRATMKADSYHASMASRRAAGYPELRAGRETQKAQGYPVLVRHREIQAAAGHPAARSARDHKEKKRDERWTVMKDEDPAAFKKSIVAANRRAVELGESLEEFTQRHAQFGITDLDDVQKYWRQAEATAGRRLPTGDMLRKKCEECRRNPCFKCDSAKPTCGRCAKRGLQCIYLPRIVKGGKGKKSNDDEGDSDSLAPARAGHKRKVEEVE
ncbi:transcription factor-like protein 17 [Elsinoe australis]|uniref:Transcription factor-like protein 17 n=1 Tax=Elsinoe australis TaxID=40998 RepID=A0A4U7ATF2_9PEZI|nr:transcription factor-like protein 17 [Elsinoe australis]